MTAQHVYLDCTVTTQAMLVIPSVEQNIYFNNDKVYLITGRRKYHIYIMRKSSLFLSEALIVNISNLNL